MPVNEEKLAAIVPGYTVTKETHMIGKSFDYTKLAIAKDGEVVARITPVDGKVHTINVTSRRVASEVGFQVGDPYETVKRVAGELTCAITTPDDPFWEHFMCQASDRVLTFAFRWRTAPSLPHAHQLTKQQVHELLVALRLTHIFIESW
jgi:hypothetical protein